MTYSVMKRMKCDRLMKRQNKFDSVIVFDEDFRSNESNVWLTFVDFCATYKFDPVKQCLKAADYDEIVDRSNQWLHDMVAKRGEKSAHYWTVINCETLYAKIVVNFAENGEIGHKRVLQVSRWPIADELYVNLYGNSVKHNFELVFNGRYIVVLLRIWLQKLVAEQTVSAPRIAFKDYWPQMMTADDYYFDSQKEKSQNRLVKQKSTNSKSEKKCLEKMQQITNRINLDIVNHQLLGNIVNIITFPSYNSNDGQSKSQYHLLTIPIGHIVNVVRVFYLRKTKQTSNKMELNNDSSEILGFADFIPECISGGGFINYPKFETQSKLVLKASQWLAQNPELKFVNCNSVDIKLKSMTSIDTGEMSFARNTGDFIRILRICYLKKYESDDDEHTNEHSEAVASTSIIKDPPPAPVYLQCKNLISPNNSVAELRKQMSDFLSKPNWKSETNIKDRWKFMSVESNSILSSGSGNEQSTSKKGKIDTNSLNMSFENSFHAISMSSSTMNRSILNGINIYYDIGYFGQITSQQNEENTRINSNTNNVQNNVNPDEKHKVDRTVRKSCQIC